MWMGGVPPLGYDVKDRTLVVNDDEARTVNHIFRRYLELRSVHALKDELTNAGIRSKCKFAGNSDPLRGIFASNSDPF
jgi:hypothetical protein